LPSKISKNLRGSWLVINNHNFYDSYLIFNVLSLLFVNQKPLQRSGFREKKVPQSLTAFFI